MQRPPRPSPPQPALGSTRRAAGCVLLAACAALAVAPRAGRTAARHSTAAVRAPAAARLNGEVAPAAWPLFPRLGRPAPRAQAHGRGTPADQQAGQIAAAVGATPVAVAPTAAGRPEDAPAGGNAAGAPAPNARPSGAAAPNDSTPDGRAPDARPLGVRRRVAVAADGTYIAELLAARDSSVTRWPERVDRPLSVWVAGAGRLADFRPTYLARVAEAFAAWGASGVPVHFRLASDSANADVHVSWVDHFREPISGRTVWTRDAEWWMTAANITLALHHNDGSPLDDDQVRAIALHEIGHLLGLDHTADSTSIMAARVRVRSLSAADLATVRLLYSLPVGHL